MRDPVIHWDLRQELCFYCKRRMFTAVSSRDITYCPHCRRQTERSGLCRREIHDPYAPAKQAELLP
jgi:hypothetical protein